MGPVSCLEPGPTSESRFDRKGKEKRQFWYFRKAFDVLARRAGSAADASESGLPTRSRQEDEIAGQPGAREGASNASG